MKVCFVTSIYPPNHYGGPGEVVSNLQKYFLSNGIDSYVLTCGSEDGNYPKTFRSLGGKRLFPITSLPKYLGKIRKFNFDIISLHGESGMGIAPFLFLNKNSKVVTTLHTEYLAESQATKNQAVKGLATTALSTEELLVKYFFTPLKLIGTYLDISVSDRIIAVSNQTKKNYLRQHNMHGNKITVIPNGVNCEKFNPNIPGDTVREKYNIGNSFLVLLVGGELILKGIPFALSAINEVKKVIPSAKLMIVGMNSKNKARIASTIKTLNNQKDVILVNRIPNEQMALFYAASDIVILPSFFENFPVSLLEAMACAKPIVASQVGGIPELVKNYENGMLVESGDLSEWTKAIIYLFQNPSERRRMGEKGRKTVEDKYDWKIIGSAYLKEFENLI